MKRVLSIAGSDSSGGAGIQADLKTFISFGCYGASAITALTAQNTQGVRGIFPVSPEFVVDQIEAVLDDVGADAIKIGMLFDASIVKAVADCLKRYDSIPIVLDPVMISTSKHALSNSDAVMALREYLFPIAYLLTPNLDEARALAGDCSMEESAEKILSMGPQAVLMKGGHGVDLEAKDYLLKRECAGGGKYFSAPWVKTENTHGTGCTLSAAIAAHLAKGFSLEEAVNLSKEYLTHALRHAAFESVGQGNGPVCHHWRMS